ncbi:Arm DNA-binding domain-containing protein [Novosphingobium sp.]|uniref:Arm DNA-binding domain-containing protein n=1 Tax=Novosphingobium sp. TaxID=1874826 RepID=UPI002FDDF970
MTDAHCRQALAGEKERKLTDARGLFLRISPTGSKSWCWKYRSGEGEKRPFPIDLARSGKSGAIQPQPRFWRG